MKRAITTVEFAEWEARPDARASIARRIDTYCKRWDQKCLHQVVETSFVAKAKPPRTAIVVRAVMMARSPQ